MTVFTFLLIATPVRAGLHYSGEAFAELPTQWRGFLPDQRLLRTLAAPSGASQPANPLRDPYKEAASALSDPKRTLTSDESADLGAILVRLGRIDAALTVLRAAQARFPDDYKIAANLATAWQMQGDLNQAQMSLRTAIKFAPGKLRSAEELHAKLLRLRGIELPGTQNLDNLFGVDYQADPAAIRAKLPNDAVSTMQLLALWLPADGRLLWQLAELAFVFGDVRLAAAMLDGCVIEFGMSDPILRRRRAEVRTLADKLAKEQMLGKGAAAAIHGGAHAGGIAFRSPRPLPRRLDAVRLPPVRADGLNPLPWSLLIETTLDRNYRPAFAKHLRELDGRRVMLTGFMQPIGDDIETGMFLLVEYPVGCWFCEAPEPNGIVVVELPEGKTASLTRAQIKVEGTLALNATDAEQFMYSIRTAKVGAVD